MRLVERHIITKNHRLFAECDRVCFAAKNLYNLANYTIRQHFFATNTVLGYNELDKLLQPSDAYRALPSKVSQQVLMQLCRNWKAHFAAMREYGKHPERFLGKPKLPRYKHKEQGHFLALYTVQAVCKPHLRNGIVRLSMTTIDVPTKQSNIQQVRISPQLDHYVIEIVYEQAPKPYDLEKTADKSKIASVDIGIGTLAAVTSNQAGFRPLLINGRPLQSMNAYYNKQKAALQSRCHGNHGGGETQTSRRIRRLTHKRNCKVDNYLHHASSVVIKELVKYGIGTLVIGKNPLWKQEVNLGKRTNQTFVNIPHARFIDQLRYKAALVGITVVLTEESYTSKCSFLDSEAIGKHETYMGKRKHRGLFVASDGRQINADINAAANILRKVFPNAFADGIQGVVARPVRITPYKVVA
jgi:putative transposase